MSAEPLSQSDASSAPLSGYRIVDIAPRIASAFAAKYLAELGADVVRVESPEPDLIRMMPPIVGSPAHECSALHLYVNGGKRSLALDYERGGRRAELERVLTGADVILNGHSPAESENLGLTEQAVASVIPSAILVSVTSFGLSGPYRDYTGTNSLLLALGGFTYLNGEPDREPVPPHGHTGEYQLGLNAAMAALTLLFGREETGVAQEADVAGMQTAAAILENSIGHFLADGFIRRRAGNGYYTGTPAVAVYECSDGFVSIALSGEHHWASLCAVLEKTEWLDDPGLQDWPSRARRGDEIAAAITEWCAARTRAEVMETFQTFRMPAAPGYSLQEVLEDPQHTERDFFQQVKHPLAGRYVCPRLPFLSSIEGYLPPQPAPLLGEHSREILTDWAGMNEAEIESLIDQGVVRASDGRRS